MAQKDKEEPARGEKIYYEKPFKKFMAKAFDCEQKTFRREVYFGVSRGGKLKLKLFGII